MCEEQRWDSRGCEQKVGVLKEVRTGFFDDVPRDEEGFGNAKRSTLGGVKR